MHYKFITAIVMGFFMPIILHAQIQYRIEADYTIKEKNSSGYENLTMGKVFYDKNQRQIVFNVLFPEKEIIIINDTASISVKSGKFQKHELGGNLIDFSVLSLFLNGDLEYFGLSKTPFKLEKVEKDDGLVISTWVMANKYAKSPVSKMLLSQKDNNLQGLITFGPNDEILSKQIFSDYISVNGMNFPGQVLQIMYTPDGGESKKITTYKNVVINSTNNNAFYNYKYKRN
jgi:hypothetical protein